MTLHDKREPVSCARVHDAQEALEASLVREVVLLAPSEVPSKKMYANNSVADDELKLNLLSQHVAGVAKVVEPLGNGSVLAFEPSLLQGSEGTALLQ